LGIASEDIQIVGGASRLIEFEDFNLIGIGPDAFPAAGLGKTGSVFERITPRGVVAHEAGHMITTRAGMAFPGGTLLDEFQANIVARTLPGLNSTERFQLLRDAVERARMSGQKPRDLVSQLRQTSAR